MCLKNLFHCFSGGQFLENQLNGNAGTRDHGLAHHHVWIGYNHVLVVAHACLSNPAYRFARGMSLRIGGFGRFCLSRTAFLGSDRSVRTVEAHLSHSAGAMPLPSPIALMAPAEEHDHYGALQ